MPETEWLVTAEEFERFPENPHYRYELVEGRLIRMSPASFEHGRIVLQLGSLLHSHLQRHGGGIVASDVGFKLKSNPDTVRGPDVAFLRSDRIPSPAAAGFVTGAPDAAFEVLSPDDRPSDVRNKIDDYLERGVSLVVVIDPRKKSVALFRPALPSATLHNEHEVLDLSDVIPGFRCTLREIFE